MCVAQGSIRARNKMGLFYSRAKTQLFKSSIYAQRATPLKLCNISVSPCPTQPQHLCIWWGNTGWSVTCFWHCDWRTPKSCSDSAVFLSSFIRVCIAAFTRSPSGIHVKAVLVRRRARQAVHCHRYSCCPCVCRVRIFGCVSNPHEPSIFLRFYGNDNGININVKTLVAH